MNKKGFSLKDFIIVLACIFIVIIILSLIIRGSLSRLTKNKKVTPAENLIVEADSYSDLEGKIKLAAERYQNTYYKGTLESTEAEVLSYKKLRESEFLKEKLLDIKDKKEECNGYVIFNKKGAAITYTPYIKCSSNYKTEGYDAKYE